MANHSAEKRGRIVWIYCGWYPMNWEYWKGIKGGKFFWSKEEITAGITAKKNCIFGFHRFNKRGWSRRCKMIYYYLEWWLVPFNKKIPSHLHYMNSQNSLLSFVFFSTPSICNVHFDSTDLQSVVFTELRFFYPTTFAVPSNNPLY